MSKALLTILLMLVGLAGCYPAFMTPSPQIWTPDAIRVFADQLRPGDCIPFGVLNDLELRIEVPDFEITARYVRRLLYQKANEMEKRNSFIFPVRRDARYDCVEEING